MRKYEIVFILRPELEEEKITEIVEKFKSLVEGSDGEITSLDKWGKRKLAYEINHITEGYYVASKFSSDSKVTNEIDRIFKISDNVIRHLIVREDD